MEYSNTNEMKRLKFQAEDGVKSYSNVAALVDDASEDFLRSNNLFDAIESFLHHHYTDRMVAQQAVFTIALDVLADHLELIQNLEARSGEEFLLKLIIPAGLKEEFLYRLVAMNITAAALFPGIDGAGKAVAEYVALRAWEAEQSKP
jgi:hypothetical protein